MDYFDQMSDTQVRNITVFSLRRAESLMQSLCAAAYPHVVQEYPAYNHFVPVLDNILNILEDGHEDGQLIDISRVREAGNLIIAAMYSYINDHVTDDYEKKSQSYDVIKRSVLIIERMLDGESIQDLIKYFKKRNQEVK